jgi:hypothetical protein
MLRRPQQPERVMALTVETQHGVDDVFEHARPGQPALLGDVTDEDDRKVPLLRFLHEPVGALADLDDGARPRTERGLVHGLDGVDDQDARLHVIDLREHAGELCLGREPQPRSEPAEPLGP